MNVAVSIGNAATIIMLVTKAVQQNTGMRK
jgi:hypothetical protein